jgi:predicted membrane protein
MAFQFRALLAGRILTAFFLILIGALMLMPHFGYDWNLDFWDFWPVILIIIGISSLSGEKGNSRHLNGIVWIVFGLLFLGSSLGFYHFRFHMIWPLLLITAGVLLLSQHVRRSGVGPADERKAGESGGDALQAFWMLGGSRNRVDSKRFRGGNAAAFLSTGTVDLKNADFEGEAVIDTLSFLGKIIILVPEHWEISMQGMSLLGNMKDKTGESVSIRPKSKPAGSKRLVIKGLAFLGDVEVSNE